MDGQRDTTLRSRARFLAELAKTGNVSQAAEKAKVSRQRVYELRNTDQKFAAAWLDALDQAADGLEQAAYQRAVLGWDEEVYTNSQGFVGYVHKFDSSLLALMLKAARPEKYRENIKVSGSIDHKIVPQGELWLLSQQIVDAVADLPDARAALSSRLLAGAQSDG